MDITPRIRVGDRLTLVGREVQGLVAGVSLYGHAALVFSTDLTPERAAVLGALVGAPVRVVLPALPVDPAVTDLAPDDAADDSGSANGSGDGNGDAAASGLDADGRVPHLAFSGVVRRVQLVSRPQGGDRLVVEALGASYALGEHHTQRRFPAHTPVDLARAFEVRVDGSASSGAPLEPLHLVQAGESDWAFLARAAADAGFVLRPAWPRTADGTATETPAPTLPDDAEVELACGFRTTDDARHLLTYGRELLAVAGGVDAVNAGVDGAHFDVAGSHAHAFRDVRQTPTWLGGGKPLVRAAVDRAADDANGGAPGLVRAPVRAPTPALYRAALRRASERRLGSAVRVTARSRYAAARPGDRVTLASGGAAGDGLSEWTLNEALAGEYGVLAVVHRWDGQLYENGFVATPWAGWHAEPADAEGAAARLLTAAWAALDAGAASRGASGTAVGAFGGAALFGAGGAGGRSGMSSVHPAHGSALADLGALGTGGGLAALRLAGTGGALGHAATGAAGAAGTTGVRPSGAGAGQPYTFGIVVDDADPLRQGRVRVRYAWQAPDAPPSACAWARVASVVAGRERGLGALPTPGDEVLVGFADGDPERPVVVGALWSGQDRAAHRPGLQHWVTAAGTTVRFVEAPAGAGAGAAGRERVELYTPEGRTWIQLAAAGPGGGPLVTVRSAGDLHLEAPNGTVRVHARHVEQHVTGDQRAEVAGAYTAHVAGAVTVESGAALGVAGAGGVALVAGGALGLHAGGGHATTGAPVQIEGGGGPRVEAPRVAPRATAWARTPVPAAGLLTHTGDRPRIKPRAGAPAHSTHGTPATRMPLRTPHPAAVIAPQPPRPCSQRGALADPNRAKHFGASIWSLHDRWNELDAEGRRAMIQTAVNTDLVPAGMPPYDVLNYPFDAGDPRSGAFDAPRWQLRVSSKLLDAPELTAAQTKELGRTVYHEARHAEQWFLTARREAASQTDRLAFFKKVPVSDRVAQAAIADPLRTPQVSASTVTGAPTTGGGGADSTLVACADAMHATYIENANVRQAAVDGLDAAWNDTSRDGDAHRRAAYARYRGLPEEADAFEAEDLFYAAAWAI